VQSVDLLAMAAVLDVVVVVV